MMMMMTLVMSGLAATASADGRDFVVDVDGNCCGRRLIVDGLSKAIAVTSTLGGTVRTTSRRCLAEGYVHAVAVPEKREWVAQTDDTDPRQ